MTKFPPEILYIILDFYNFTSISDINKLKSISKSFFEYIYTKQKENAITINWKYDELSSSPSQLINAESPCLCELYFPSLNVKFSKIISFERYRLFEMLYKDNFDLDSKEKCEFNIKKYKLTINQSLFYKPLNILFRDHKFKFCVSSSILYYANINIEKWNEKEKWIMDERYCNYYFDNDIFNKIKNLKVKKLNNNSHVIDYIHYIYENKFVLNNNNNQINK